MIPKTFEDAFAQVKTLVEKFKNQESHYLSPKYQEAEVRQEFLDKLFVALGWDVYHDEQANPYEREVRIEKSVMVQGRGKRADYAFYTAPNFAQVRFMAEAKKPSRQLENAQDCFQAIRYGWNSNAPVSVLTDFEQFLILDSRYKPNIETATQRIIKKFHYAEYADEEKFREIYYLFSRESVGNNALEDFALSLKKGRGARQNKLFNTAIIQPIDEEFLSELDEQRLILAKAFKKTNYELDGETLTEITQRTLDRLVFLRFLEDKLVEPDSVIDKLGEKSGNAWRDFIGEMPRLNSIYNGTLFRTHTILDNPNFAPDERAFRETQDWLSHKNSPYDFNSIPIHILGSIYERFLGKTIETTDKRASVVDKPEVRKAGGVYYTPEYIVRYIVENTIGKLIEKKKPEDIAELRFADIACGSGSFLLGVFDFLIAYHVEWFSENKTRREKAVKDGLCRETVEGILQLTIQYKREILLNNIYGVDLDAQAVEVAQFSLYLKLLEEETTATKQQFLAGFREQLLPSLGNNIVHGNSLIDYDIMDGMLFDTRELKQLNPLNFQSTFPEVFKNGGFDAIVGNPPYGADLNKHQTEYLKRKYDSASYQLDTYPIFIEKSLKLLKQNGISGLIVPSAWVAAKYNSGLRKILKVESSINSIVIAPKKVFKDATVETLIIVYERKLPDDKDFLVERWDLEEKVSYLFSTNFIDEINDYVFSIYSNPEKINLIRKVKSNSILLGEIGNAVWGVKIYQKGKGVPKQKGFESSEKIFHSKLKEKETHKPLLGGGEIERYLISWKGAFVDYGKWLAEPRSSDWFEGERIVIREVTNKGNIQASITNENYVFSNSVDGVRMIENCLYSPIYILALLNSKVISFYNSNTSANAFKNTFPKVLIKDLLNFPIPIIDFTKPDEKSAHDRMVEMVEKMLAGKKSLAEARTDKDRAFYERYCSSLDGQIDALVYELYGLSADEIKIIEANG